VPLIDLRWHTRYLAGASLAPETILVFHAPASPLVVWLSVWAVSHTPPMGGSCQSWCWTLKL
jgi:hypothetical protein